MPKEYIKAKQVMVNASPELPEGMQLQTYLDSLGDRLGKTTEILSSNYTLTSDDHNKTFLCTNTELINIYVPDVLPTPFDVELIVTGSALKVLSGGSKEVMYAGGKAGIFRLGDKATVHSLPSDTQWSAWMGGGTFTGILKLEYSDDVELSVELSSTANVVLNQIHFYSYIIKATGMANGPLEVTRHYVKGEVNPDNVDVNLSIQSTANVVLNQVT